MRVAARLVACWTIVSCAGEVAWRAGAPAALRPGIARAEEAWRAEFERVCSRTDDAMTMSSDELRSLVARCDVLKGPIGALEESERKVLTRRLKLCRDLYQFVLETREQK